MSAVKQRKTVADLRSPIGDVEAVLAGEANWTVAFADALDLLSQMPECSVNAVVVDPPYELAFMGKSWDSMGLSFRVETWQAVLRVLKPGGHLLSFGGTRTWHRIACAIEDAGFEIRDEIMWMHGSGFPKSRDVSKAIDKVAGATDEVQTWQGWGTALKPAHEPIIVARKPLVGTVAGNVLAYGVGGLNIDATRVSSYDGSSTARKEMGGNGSDLGRWPANVILTHHEDCETTGTKKIKGDNRGKGSGRRKSGFVNVGAENGDGEHNGPVYGDGQVEVWNCHPDCPVRLLDEQTGTLKSGSRRQGAYTSQGTNAYGEWAENERAPLAGSKGGASRFFYCAKVSKKERNAGLPDGLVNNHPTVKPIELMRYLCRLVTSPSGVVLDFCAGSGSTGCAVVLEGFRFVGVEQDVNYIKIARARIAHWEQQA